jgi:RNase P subunit RPR2
MFNNITGFKCQFCSKLLRPKINLVKSTFPQYEPDSECLALYCSICEREYPVKDERGMSITSLSKAIPILLDLIKAIEDNEQTDETRALIQQLTLTTQDNKNLTRIIQSKNETIATMKKSHEECIELMKEISRNGAL